MVRLESPGLAASVAWVACLVACAAAPGPPPARGDQDGAGGDPGPGDPLTLGSGLTATTAAGSTTGELVAVYDHSRWWHDPVEELTLALFAPAGLADYPDDQSFTFLSSTELLALTPAARPAPGYRDALRERGVLLSRLPLAGVSFVITAHDSYHLEEDGFGDYAWDFVLTDASGRRFGDGGVSNDDYWVWDAEVLLPAAGTVIEVVADAPDNPPGTYPTGAVNNIVGLHLFGSFYLYLFHFRQHTIAAEVVPGAFLPAGTSLGRVGNSGVSLEPHLHVTLYWYDGAGTGRSWSVPGEFTDLCWSRTPTGPSEAVDFLTPEAGMWVSETPF